MSASIEYKINAATYEDVLRHLERCNFEFVPPLDSRVEIHEYAHKLVTRSVLFEAWTEHDLSGLIAAYFNDKESRTAFITNVSTLREQQGNGIGSQLLKMCIDHANELGFCEIRLEVESSNLIATGLYEKHGFKLAGARDKMSQMLLVLDRATYESNKGL